MSYEKTGEAVFSFTDFVSVFAAQHRQEGTEGTGGDSSDRDAWTRRGGAAQLT